MDVRTSSMKMMRGKAVEKNVLHILHSFPEISTVCFDFFDTLVYRTEDPEQVKMLACKQFSLLAKRDLDAHMLYQLRRTQETRLCRQSMLQGKDSEVNIVDLAGPLGEELKKYYGAWPFAFPEKEFPERLLSIEIRVEKQVQHLFEDVKNLLSVIKGHDLKTFIVSDFYIPGFAFRQFLEHHGLSNDFNDLFVSCDYGLNKISGRLYEKLFETTHQEPRQFLMIGDNAHSDVHTADSKGMHTYHIRKNDFTIFAAMHLNRKTKGVAANKSLEIRIRRIVRKEGGPLFPEMAVTLWNFTQLLFHRLINDGASHVFFLSKEGQFLKRLFEQYQDIQFGTQIIDSDYLMVSRRSTFICSLNSLEEESFSRLFRQYRDTSPRDFLMSLNFDENEAESLCKEIHLDYETRLENFPKSDAFFDILRTQSFSNLYHQKRRSQKENFLRYLYSFHVDFHNAGLNLVDVGWKGSIQDNIFFALDGNVRIHGYYIGMLIPTNRTEMNRKTGVLFWDTPERSLFFEAYDSNKSLFEMILSATHGSAQGYYQDPSNRLNESAGFIPANNNSIQTDQIQVKTMDLPEEEELFRQKIEPIQKCIYTICKKINQEVLTSSSSIPEQKWFAEQHARMTFRPTTDEVAFFENLFHAENFGVFEWTRFKNNKPIPLKERIDNLKKVIQDPESVLKDYNWAPIVLKRKGIGFYARRFGNQYYRKLFGGNNWLNYFYNEKKIVEGLNRFKRKKNIAICFLLNDPNPRKDARLILDYATGMRRLGFRVFILTKDDVFPDQYAWHFGARNLEWFTFDAANNLKFDYAIATNWWTALFLRFIDAESYSFFITQIDAVVHGNKNEAGIKERAYASLAESTCLLPIPIFTRDVTVKQYLKEKFGRDVIWLEYENKNNGTHLDAVNYPENAEKESLIGVSRNFEKILKKLKARTRIYRDYLNRLTDQLWESYDHQVALERFSSYDPDEKDEPQCCQFYWHYGQEFNEFDSVKIFYKNGEWKQLQAMIRSSSSSLSLRIDPAARPGIIFIKWISVQNTETGGLLFQKDDTHGWTEVKVEGTALLLSMKSMLVLESSDEDPRLVLQPIFKLENTAEIMVSISLRYLSFREAAREAGCALDASAFVNR